MNKDRLIFSGPSRAGWHRLDTFLRCPRRYAMNQSHQSDMGEALVRGILVHQGLAHYYALQKDPTAELYDPRRAMHEVAYWMNEEKPNDLWQKWADHLETMPDQYALKWAGQENSWEIVGVEEEMGVRIQDPAYDTSYIYTQRADLVIRHKHTGLYHIVDHKTAGYAPPQVHRRYSMSGQFVGYSWLGKLKWGKEFGGVILNVIQVPTLHKDPTYIFARPALEPTPRAVQDFKNTILHAERGIAKLRLDVGHESTDAANWPAVYGEGPPCLGPYAPCPFREHCRGS
jgi:hypothetical protein